MEMDNLAKAELCESIVEQLEKYGHCTGKYQDNEGQLCLLGAGRMAQAEFAGVQRHQRPSEMTAHDAARIMDEADERTRQALNDKYVHLLNDGHLRTLDSDGVIMSVTYHALPPLNKETAIEYATKMAKHWRNEPS